LTITITITVNGKLHTVAPGTSIAAALTQAGIFRKSVGGQPRGPLCGMGVCFECRVRVGKERAVRACLVACQDGMEIET